LREDLERMPWGEKKSCRLGSLAEEDAGAGDGMGGAEGTVDDDMRMVGEGGWGEVQRMVEMLGRWRFVIGKATNRWRDGLRKGGWHRARRWVEAFGSL
jgi:hypothetical protein